MGMSHGEIVLSSSLCPPAVRIMLVMAYFDADAIDLMGNGEIATSVEFLPVVAIQSTLKVGISREAGGWAGPGRLVAGSIREARRMGCKIGERGEETVALVVNFDGYITAVEDELKCTNTAGRLAACPWPPEEDARRLGDTVARVLDDLRGTPAYAKSKQRLSQK